MLNFKLVNSELPEGAEIKFKAKNIDDAKEVVRKYFPQYYYGCNIICLDNSDFACIAVKSYFEERYKLYGTPMPV